jgi:tellurite methyltransferase
LEPRAKWNSKHKDRINHLRQPAPNVRLKNLAPYLTGGLALDLACGLGANSLFLAQLRYQVQAIDISDVAVDYVKEQAEIQQLTVNPQLSDLKEWSNLNVKKCSFDLVVITYYLDRLIFPFIKSIVKENGYFFMETFYMSPMNEQQGISDQYKLRPKELLTIFENWQVLYYEENEQEGRQTIFVRNISKSGQE